MTSAESEFTHVTKMAFNLLVNGLECGTLCFVEDRPLYASVIKVNVIKRLIEEVSVLKFPIISRLAGVYVSCTFYYIVLSILGSPKCWI